MKINFHKFYRFCRFYGIKFGEIRLSVSYARYKGSFTLRRQRQNKHAVMNGQRQWKNGYHGNRWWCSHCGGNRKQKILNLFVVAVAMWTKDLNLYCCQVSEKTFAWLYLLVLSVDLNRMYRLHKQAHTFTWLAA